MNKASDGKGGGKPNFAQGGTSNTKSDRSHVVL